MATIVQIGISFRYYLLFRARDRTGLSNSGCEVDLEGSTPRLDDSDSQAMLR